MSLLLERVESPTGDARMLIGELDAELNGAYAPDQRHGLSLAGLFRPEIAFFIARLDGLPAGCGGISFEGPCAELKRMYVRPPARGQRVARAILSHLQDVALARGVTRVYLETGDAQQAAIRFYEREGFARCPAFGHYATMPPDAIRRSVFFEKRLG